MDKIFKELADIEKELHVKNIQDIYPQKKPDITTEISLKIKDKLRSGTKLKICGLNMTR